MFTSRGMSLHQRKCSKKLFHNKAKAKKTRAYKFCILNESVHEEVLSYLSNQTLTKMQMITGDQYDGCEPELAKICCKCENDNFTNDNSLCGECLSPQRRFHFYREYVTNKMTMNFYGVKDKDLVGLPHKTHGNRYLYQLATLEKFTLKTCGSKKNWLRHLVKVRARLEKDKAAKSRKKKFYDFLVNHVPELARLVKTSHYKDLRYGR